MPVRFTLFLLSKSRLESPDSHIRGDDRIRTGDPLLAKQMLSQLSYSPSAKRARRAPRIAERGGSGWI